MPITRNGTKRPREPLLQLSTVAGCAVRRIARRQRTRGSGPGGAAVEILASAHLASNALSARTLLGG